MPLGILAITAVGGLWLGLSWVAALLLAASLAPTDPVLASDVQVGPPKSGEEDEVRFGLTSEAGLNDGYAFPFVHLAIALGLAASTGEPWAKQWLLHNVLWEISAGVLGGWLIGRLFGWLTFHTRQGRITRRREAKLAGVFAAELVGALIANAECDSGPLALMYPLRHSTDVLCPSLTSSN